MSPASSTRAGARRRPHVNGSPRPDRGDARQRSDREDERDRRLFDRRQAREEATTFFKVSGSVGERDFTAGLRDPLPPVAPAGCVSATLSPWSAKSAVVKLNK